MIEPYSFEYEGVAIVYQRATVRTGLESTRIRQKLIDALGYVDQMPTDEFANVSTYADTMARSKANAAWWCHSNMTEEEIKAAFELFLEQDEELYLLFNRAHRATLAPKKTIEPTAET